MTRRYATRRYTTRFCRPLALYAFSIALFGRPEAARAELYRFTVEVPSCTPDDRPVYLRSNRTSAAEFRHDEMTKTGERTYEVSVDVSVQRAELRYKYSSGICSALSCPGIEKALTFRGSGGERADRTWTDGQLEANDRVDVWRHQVTTFDAAGQSTGLRAAPEEQVNFCAPYLYVSSTDGEVAVGYDAYFGAPASLAYGVTPTALASISDDVSAHRHHLVFDSLPNDVTIHYEIRESNAPRHQSSFRTRPSPGQSLRFVALGDTQYVVEDNLTSFIALRERALAFDPHLAISSGDMVHSEKDANGVWIPPESGRWNAWFNVAGALLRRVPFAMAMGNHEEDAPYFWDAFRFPTPHAPFEDHYWFRYGNVQFIALYTGKTDGYDREGILSSQTSFLEDALADLAEDPEVRWRVVFLHRGVFSEGTRHGDGWQFYEGGTAGRASWAELFQRYGVDVVVAGHNHNFTLAEADGIRFITQCSGAPTHPIHAVWQPTTIYAEEACTIGLFEAGSRTLTFVAERVDGSPVDEARFTLCRETADCTDLHSPCDPGDVTSWSCLAGACASSCGPTASLDDTEGVPAPGVDAGPSPEPAAPDTGGEGAGHARADTRNDSAEEDGSHESDDLDDAGSPEEDLSVDSPTAPADTDAPNGAPSAGDVVSESDPSADPLPSGPEAGAEDRTLVAGDVETSRAVVCACALTNRPDPAPLAAALLAIVLAFGRRRSRWRLPRHPRSVCGLT